MPELPEIETIVRFLKSRIVSKTIDRIWTNTDRIFSDHRNFKKIALIAKGGCVQNVDRWGKNVVLFLSKHTILIHLGMSGKLLLSPKSNDSSYIRFKIFFKDGCDLWLHDVRKFSKIRLKSNQSKDGELGADALTVSYSDFENIIGQRRKIIKILLLDQGLISGIGNIYVDEILWAANIHPLTLSSDLSSDKIQDLHRAIKSVLRLAIKKRGTSFKDYRLPDGTRGDYYSIRKVYQRTGEKCFKDGAIIQRIKVSQRSTYFCPEHQRYRS